MSAIIIFKIRGPMIVDDGSFERGKNSIDFNRLKSALFMKALLDEIVDIESFST